MNSKYKFKFQDFRSKVLLLDLMKKGKSEFRSPKTKLKKVAGNNHDLYLKLEYQNDGMSFKTRAAIRLIGSALKKKYSKVFAHTSGNLGLSISKLASRRKLFSNIYINNNDYPKMRLLEKSASLLEHGSSDPSVISRIFSFICAVFKVWDFWWFYSNKSLFESKAAQGYFLAQPSIYINPESLFGYSEISWESFRQLGNKEPDYVITPIVNSDNAIGQWLGYYTLYKEGKISKLPHFVLVERKKLVKHFNYPDAWTIIKKLSKVSVVEVSEYDEEISKKYLKRKYNILLEKVSAGVWSGYGQLKRENYFNSGSTVVLILSGSNV